ncbi:MAG: hypothetical protein ACKO14_05090 [Armatimonadota bacterium]
MEIFHPLSNLRIAYEPSERMQNRDLVLHFHGTHDIVFGAVKGRFSGAVAASVSLNGLSGAYQAYVGKDAHWMFVKLIAEIQQASGVSNFSSITLSSFSAGYGAIRALLSDPKCMVMIDNLVLADTVYASFGEARNIKGSRPFPNIEQNKPFIDFAKLAVRGGKGMVITHCELEPETYSSTEEVGTLVRDAIAAPLSASDEEWPGGLSLKGKVRKGRFVSIATRGNQGSDHLAHLRALGTWYRLLPRV